MSFDSLNHEELLSSIRICLNPFSISSDRKLAEAHLNQIKHTNSQHIFELFMDVLRSNQMTNISVLQLVLSLLNDWISTWWNRLSNEDHGLIKSSVLQLLFESRITNVKAMRNKLSVIISNIAKRQFPQYWESFITDMIEIWLKSSPEHQEIVMTSINILVTDCIDPDFSSSLPTLRKQDILTGVRKNLESLVEVCSQYLSHLLSQYQNNSGNNNHIYDQIVTLLKLLQPIVSYVKSDYMFHIQPNLLIFIPLLSIDGFQMEASNLLYHWCNHKLNQFETFYEILNHVVSHPLNLQPSSINITEFISFQTLYGQSMINLLSYNISHITNKSNFQTSSDKSVLQAFFSILAVIITFPSLRFAYDAVSDWTTIYHDQEFALLPEAESLAQKLLREYLNKTVRVLWTKEGDEMVCPDEIISSEFDTFEEYKEFLSYLKSQTRSLVSILLQKYPTITYQEICSRLHYLMTVEVNNIDNYHGQILNGYVIEESSLLLRGLESLQPPLDECLKFVQLLASEPSHQQLIDTTVRHHDDTFANIQSSLFIIFDTLLGWDVNDPHIMKWRIRLLIQYCSLLNINNDYSRIQGLLRFFFNNLNFQLDKRSLEISNFKSKNIVDNLLEEGVIIRRRMAAGLSQLCSTCSIAIRDSNFYNDFVIKVYGSIRDESNGLLTGQRASLRECLIILSENAKDPKQRDELLTMAMQSVVEQWSYFSSRVFASTTSLIESVTYQASHTAASKKNEKLLNGSTIYHEEVTQSLLSEHSGGSFSVVKSILNTIISISKRVSVPKFEEKIWLEGVNYDISQLIQVFPFGYVWTLLLPGIYQAIKTCNELWTPNFRSRLSLNEAEDLYSPNATTLLNISRSTLEADHTETSTGDSSTSLAYLLSQIRRLLYQVIGISCTHLIFYYSSDHFAIIKNISDSLNYMENLQYTILINQFIVKYITYAPPNQSSIVSSLLEIFLIGSRYRLLIAWNKNIDDSQDHGAISSLYEELYRDCSVSNRMIVGVPPDMVELAKERIIVSFSRSFADVLSIMAGLQGPLADKPNMPVTSETNTNRSKKGHNLKQIKTTAVYSSIDEEAITEDVPVAVTEVDPILEAKRMWMLGLIFSPSNIHITRSYVQSVLTLVCNPDPVCIRKGSSLSDFLLKMSITDERLRPVLGRDFFSALIAIVLEEKKGIIGLEWDIVDSVQRIYCCYVLGADTNTLGHVDTVVTDSSEMENEMLVYQKTLALQAKRESGIEEKGCLSVHPRLVLLGIPNVEAFSVFKLELELLESSSSKKKRRDLFRDFLSGIIDNMKLSTPRSAGIPNSPTTQKSIFSRYDQPLATTSTVLNIQERVLRAKPIVLTALDQNDFSLNSLFDD